MASPFKTYQEYYEATGPIYTFSDRPFIIGLLLVVSVVIFLYFIYATFTMNKGSSNSSNPIIMSVLLATTAFSAAEAIYQNISGQEKQRPTTVSRQAETQKGALPVVLGMMTTLGATATRRVKLSAKQPRRSKRVRLR